MPESRTNHSTSQRIGDHAILIAVLGLATALMIFSGRWRPALMNLAGVDAAGHYAWLRSPLLDHDLEFGNDYEHIMEPHVWEMHREPLAATGHHADPFPIGTAIVLLPGFVVAHLLLRFTALGRHWPADGFSLPYGVAAHWSLWLCGAVGLLLLHAWLRRHWPRGIALAATLLTWFATGAVLYTFPDIINNHSPELAAMPLFLLLWERWQEKPAVPRAILAGLVSGMLFLIRWQLALWPAVFWVGAALEARRSQSIRRTLWVLPIPALLLSLPQFVAWHVVYGRWLLIPQGGGYIHWLRPMILPLLFSTYRGWITWTPLVGIGLIGLGLGWRRDRPLVTLLAVGLLLQLYVSSIVEDWHGAFGFSARRLVHATPLIAWGVAAVLHAVSAGQRRRLVLASLTLGLLVIWNALFLVQYYQHLIPYHRGLTWHELIGDKFHIMASLQRRYAVRNVMGAIDDSREAMRAGDRVEAAKILDLGERWLRAAQREDPEHEDVYLAAASLAMERGDVLGALSEYQACLDQLGVDRPQILTSMGACALYGGRPNLAAEFAQRALAIAPNYADAQRLLDDARDGVRDESHRLWFY